MRKFYESLEQMFSNVTELKYGLARRLERGAEDLFPNAQLRYRREPGLDCGGPTLLEIVDHSRRCRQLLDEASALPLPPRIAARVSEDERCFVYGERTVAYYHACVDALRDARAGRRAEAQGHFARAQRLADQLRTDKISAADSSSHANAENALAATLASGALPHVDRLLRAAK
jgi:hypothetical protein